MPVALTRAVAVLLLAASAMFGQSKPARPAFDAFEVATVKLTPLEEQRGRYIRMESVNLFHAHNHTLKTLIQAAYNLTPRAFSGGPSWIDSDHYDVVARTPNEIRPTPDEQMAMLRKLLADRFQLTFHRDRKELNVYALTISKTGSKLKESTLSEDSPALINTIFPDHVLLPARNTTMAQFASLIQRVIVDAPVLDRTGLSGKYDFDLEWTPDETQFGGQLVMAPVDSPKPEFFVALQQQLGLKLEATKGPVEVMIVDRAQRPSDN